MRKLVIDRKRWLRGDVFKTRSVLRSRATAAKGAMCCLGFYLRDLGVPMRTLLDRETPADLQANVPEEGAWLLKKPKDGPGRLDSDICDELTTCNDDYLIAESEREKQIAKLFERRGVAVSFVN